MCPKKGCWTVLRQGDASVRVRFKDYGFFLPKDSSGKQPYVEGVVNVETLSEKTARHCGGVARGRSRRDPGPPARDRLHGLPRSDREPLSSRAPVPQT